MRRRTSLQRRTRIKPVSAKRRAENRHRRRNALDTYGDQPPCAVPWCTRPADDLHEIKTRARGGSITDMANTAPLCRPHHTEITDEQPDWAYDLGLLAHSWERGSAA